MATRRKPYTPHRAPAPTDPYVYAEFVKDLLDGTITATKLIDTHNGQGKATFEYDDPNG